MYMTAMAYTGMPPRGSLQDRVATEVLLRRRRQEVAKQAYLGRLITAGLQLPDVHFDFWTNLLETELTGYNYTVRGIERNKDILRTIGSDIARKEEVRVQKFQKLHKLTATDAGLRPSSAAEVEEMRRRLRRRFIKPTK